MIEVKRVYECPCESANICDGLGRQTKIFVLRIGLSCQNLKSAIFCHPLLKPLTINVGKIYSDIYL